MADELGVVTPVPNPQSEAREYRHPVFTAGEEIYRGFDITHQTFLDGEGAALARLVGFYKQAQSELYAFMRSGGIGSTAEDQAAIAIELEIERTQRKVATTEAELEAKLARLKELERQSNALPVGRVVGPTASDTEYYGALLDQTRATMAKLRAGATEYLKGTLPVAFVEGAKLTGGRDFLFRPQHERALRYLSGYTLGLIRDTNDGILRGVQQAVGSALSTGITREELATRLIDSGLQPGPWRDAATRAAVIARTETMRAYNAGNVAAVRETGAVAVEWHTSQDERVCRICGPLDGQAFVLPGVSDEERAAGGVPSEWVTLEAVGVRGNVLKVPPRHPRCRCTVRARYRHDDGSMLGEAVPPDDKALVDQAKAAGEGVQIGDDDFEQLRKLPPERSAAADRVLHEWEQRVAAEEHARNPRPGYGGTYGPERGIVIDNQTGEILWEGIGEAATLGKTDVEKFMRPGSTLSHFHPDDSPEAHLSDGDINTAAYHGVSVRAYNANGAWMEYRPDPGDRIGLPMGLQDLYQIAKEQKLDVYDVMEDFAANHGAIIRGVGAEPGRITKWALADKWRSLTTSQLTDLISSGEVGEWYFEDFAPMMKLRYGIDVRAIQGGGVAEQYGITRDISMAVTTRHMTGLVNGLDYYERVGMRWRDNPELRRILFVEELGTHPHFEGVQKDAHYDGQAKEIVYARSSLGGERFTQEWPDRPGMPIWDATVIHELGHATQKRVMGEGAFRTTLSAFRDQMARTLPQPANADTLDAIAEWWYDIYYGSKESENAFELDMQWGTAREGLKESRTILADPEISDARRATHEELVIRFERQVQELSKRRFEARNAEPHPTDYGKKAQAEDFADSVYLYLTNPRAFQRRFPRRYALLEKHLGVHR